MWVTCGTAFATAQGRVTLRTFPRDERREPRQLGSPASFTCTPTQRIVVVELELPVKDRRLVEQLGRLRVRATARATNETGADTTANSHFTLVPERP